MVVRHTYVIEHLLRARHSFRRITGTVLSLLTLTISISWLPFTGEKQAQDG